MSCREYENEGIERGTRQGKTITGWKDERHRLSCEFAQKKKRYLYIFNEIIRTDE